MFVEVQMSSSCRLLHGSRAETTADEALQVARPWLERVLSRRRLCRKTESEGGSQKVEALGQDLRPAKDYEAGMGSLEPQVPLGSCWRIPQLL